MGQNAYYVYALKDPRTSPAKPFYIGKGTGIRAWEHLTTVDGTRKGQRISEIIRDGKTVIVTKLADGLSEFNALKLEAELISAFGIEEFGGMLTNSVRPSGTSSKPVTGINLPMGIHEKAQLGLGMLKEAVLELANANPDGVTNAEFAKSLGLQSDYSGGSKDYLSFSVLGLLMREGKIIRAERAKYKTITNSTSGYIPKP